MQIVLQEESIEGLMRIEVGAAQCDTYSFGVQNQIIVFFFLYLRIPLGKWDA